MAEPEVNLAKTYDGVIVGSGAAGGMAAHVLTSKGLQVLLLEAGKKLPIEQELRFKVLVRGSRIVTAGTATSLNISSRGVWFNVPNLNPKLPVELSIDWPVLLDESSPLQLIVFGSIIRSNDEGTGVSIDRYEFRTRRTLQIVPFIDKTDGTAKLA